MQTMLLALATLPGFDAEKVSRKGKAIATPAGLRKWRWFEMERLISPQAGL